MTDFVSWWEWMRFNERVRHRTRYIYSADTERFLDALIATSASRCERVEVGASYWRAQIGCDTEERSVGGTTAAQVSVPYGPERMKPLPRSAHEGRVNPKGIPCLYLASDSDTAIAEVRPWVGGLVSVGEFAITRPLKVIDFSNEDESVLKFYDVEPDSDVRQKVIWAQIGRSFSRPITDEPATADYVPTQIVAERIKQHGIDGVRYRSFLGGGVNMALFDLNAAAIASSTLHEIVGVSFQSQERSA